MFKGTRIQFALVRNNAPKFVETNGQSLPTVTLWLHSRKSTTDEVQFFDVNLHQPTLAENFQHAHIPKPPATVNSKVRIDVTIEALRAFYSEAKMRSPKIKGDFMPTDNCFMQTGFDQLSPRKLHPVLRA